MIRAKVSAAAMFAAASLLLVGCGLQSGKTIVTTGPGVDPVLQTAPESGTYELYTAASPNPTMTVQLKQGDQLGFRKNGDNIVAIAGSQEHELGVLTVQAYWKLQR